MVAENSMTKRQSKDYYYTLKICCVQQRILRFLLVLKMYKRLVRSQAVVLKSGRFSGFDGRVERFERFADFLCLAQNHLVVSWWVHRRKHDVGRTSTSVLDPRQGVEQSRIKLWHIVF